jgi:hypothetical protein
MTRASEAGLIRAPMLFNIPHPPGTGTCCLDPGFSNEFRKLGGKVHVGNSLTPGALGTTSWLPCSSEITISPAATALLLTCPSFLAF